MSNQEISNNDILEMKKIKNNKIRIITILSSTTSVMAWILAFYFYFPYNQISNFHFYFYNNLAMKFQINITIIYMFGCYFTIIKLVFIYFLVSKKDMYMLDILNERANYFFVINDILMSLALIFPILFVKYSIGIVLCITFSGIELVNSIIFNILYKGYSKLLLHKI